jgi:rhodanese-related sulfurtransferase
LTAPKPIVDLTRENVKQGLADGSILLVDVREPNEWEAGHIEGSVLFPLSTFDPAALPDPRGKRLVFSCRSGNRSVTAINRARMAGLDVSEHYKGGFKDWAESGEPYATGD